MSERECGVTGCLLPYRTTGYCSKHYQRWYKYGDPLFTKPRAGNSKPRPIPTERTCRDCSHVGPLAEFAAKRNVCLPCTRKRLRQWKIANPEKAAAMRERSKNSDARAEWNLRSRARSWGLDPEKVLAYYKAHDGKCEICGGTNATNGRDLSMDHCHETGKFRGMLCDNCNQGLGRFKDDADRLRLAIKYLEAHAV